MRRAVILLADRLPPALGGMEVHGAYFARYFQKHGQFELAAVVTKDEAGRDLVLESEGGGATRAVEGRGLAHVAAALRHRDSRPVLFFNSGKWIEELDAIRADAGDAILCQRTGGNDVVQARLGTVLPISDRQRIWAAAINRNIDYLVSNSRYTDRRLRTLGIECSRIVRVPGGVDVRACDRAGAGRDTLRTKYFGRMAARSIAVVACRLVEFKGVDTTIRAVAIARRSADVALVCVGDGPLEPELASLATELLGPGNSLFLGALAPAESLEVIAAGDVLCALSREWVRHVPGGDYVHTETMGRSVIEAICSGVPVVASSVGGLPEVVTGTSGQVVPPEAPEVAARAILECLSTGRRRGEAVDEARRQYAWERVFESYVTLWRSRA